jgi:Flp pilus assembly protein TadD
LIFPVRQNFDYDYPVSRHFLTPEVLLPLLLLLGLFGSALALWWRSAAQRGGNPWGRLISFGIIWFFVTISVESSIIPIDDLLLEHRVYLPSCGFFLAIFGLLGLMESKNIYLSTRFVWVGLLLVVTVLGVATVNRNRVWSDNVTFWQDVVHKSPNKPRGYDHLSFWLTKAGCNAEAITVVRQGLALAPGNFNLQMHLGAALTALNRFEEAVTAFRQATVSRPDDAQAHANLAATLFRLGEIAAGREEMAQAVELNRDTYGKLQLSLGIALTSRAQFPDALKALHEAVTALPNDAQVHNTLATTYLMTGDVTAGRRSLLKALELDPNYGSAHYNLACLLEKEGRLAEALAEMQKALQANANDASLQEKIARLRQAIAEKGLP